MRLAARLTLSIAIITAACARPVLYYPTPESAGATGAAAAPTVTPAGAPSNGGSASDASASPPAAAATTASADMAYLMSRHLLVPVAGADMSKVYDSFDDSRGDGERTHHAIDILAPRGTPILAADDGRVLRMSSNTLGGITMYTVDPERRLVYYYAHMDRYNDAMSPGRPIVKGDTLGYVGTTGDAPKNTPHLHFQVMRWPADGKYWNGEPLDPYAALGGVPRASAEREERGGPRR